MFISVTEYLRKQVPPIMQRWEDRVRAEVPAATEQDEDILRDNLAEIIEVVAKILSCETDPRTAARDLALFATHAQERAAQPEYSLEAMILECHILQEVVLESLETAHTLAARDRIIIARYFSELVRLAAGEFARFQAEQL